MAARGAPARRAGRVRTGGGAAENRAGRGRAMAATMELRPECDEAGGQAALPSRRRGRHQKTGRVHRTVKPGAAARLPARRETRSTAHAQPQAVFGVAAVFLSPAYDRVTL